MPIQVNLDVMMARRKVAAGELAARVGITPANLSILKTNKAKAVRFSTLEALCRELGCQPGDLLEYLPGADAAPDADAPPAAPDTAAVDTAAVSSTRAAPGKAQPVPAAPTAPD